MSLKQDIKDAMIVQLQADIEAAEAARDRAHKASDLAEDEPLDSSEIAQSSVDLGMASSFDEEINDMQRQLEALKELDVSPRSTVGPGALVDVDDELFLVSFASDEVTVGKKTVLGISTQAPYYQAMAGMQAGDTFTVNGRTQTIAEVS